jgi:adenylosuccinate synthase
VSGICLTKLDVLDGLEEIKVCVAYKTKEGDELSRPPLDGRGYADIEPIFETLPGWTESTLGTQTLEALPENARAYIRYLESKIEAPIDIVSTGPDRMETIVLRHPFDA